MRDILRAGIVLFIISLCASVSLAFVSEQTKDPIHQQEVAKEDAARKKLLPEATTFEELDKETAPEVQKIVVGKKDADIVGYIFSVAPKGYAGAIDMAVAVNVSGEIAGVEVLKQSETPGLGANITKEGFIGQYTGKLGPFEVVKSEPSKDTEIQAITSATISSKAVTSGINKALEAFQSIQ